MSKKLNQTWRPTGQAPTSTAWVLLVPFLFILATCSLYLPSFDNPFDPASPIYAVHTSPTILAPAAGHEFTAGFTLVWKKAGTVADTYRLQVASDQDFRPGSVVLDVELTDVDRYTVSSVPFHGPVYCRLALKVEQQGQTWSPWSTSLMVVKVAPEGNRAPEVSLVTSDPVAAVGGQTVTISAEGSDPDGDAVVYRWYVDGVLQSCRSADFYFAVPGSAMARIYTVEVETWDGALVSDRLEIRVEAVAGGGSNDDGAEPTEVVVSLKISEINNGLTTAVNVSDRFNISRTGQWFELQGYLSHLRWWDFGPMVPAEATNGLRSIMDYLWRLSKLQYSSAPSEPYTQATTSTSYASSLIQSFSPAHDLPDFLGSGNSALLDGSLYRVDFRMDDASISYFTGNGYMIISETVGIVYLSMDWDSGYTYLMYRASLADDPNMIFFGSRTPLFKWTVFPQNGFIEESPYWVSSEWSLTYMP